MGLRVALGQPWETCGLESEPVSLRMALGRHPQRRWLLASFMVTGQHHGNLMRHTPVTPNKFASLSSSSLAKKESSGSELRRTLNHKSSKAQFQTH